MADTSSPKGEPRTINPPDPAQRPSQSSGALFERRGGAADGAAIADTCAAPLARHLEGIADWASVSWKVGDFNQCRLSTTVDGGVDLVLTVTSEPLEDPRCRIALGPPGTLVDHPRREALARFGFVVSIEDCSSWERDVRMSSAREAATAAADILSLLTDVFGYDGTSALDYCLSQGQRAELAPLYRTLSPEDLRKLMHGWGYRAEVGTTVSGNPVIRTGAGGFKFHILFAWPAREGPFFGCLNFVTVFLGRPNLTLAVINEISRTSRFARLYLDEENDLILERDVALTGGVSAAYLQECLLDWSCMMDSVTKKLERLVEPPETAPVVLH